MDDGADTARTIADLQRRLETLDSLLAIQSLGVKGAFDQASQAIAALMQADKVDIFLYDPAMATLIATGVSDTPMGRRQKELGLDRLPLANGGRTVEVFQTGQPFLTGRADADPYVLPGVKGPLGVRSMLAVPFAVAGQRRGVLSVVSGQADRFTPQDLRFAEVVARQVGLVAQRTEAAEQLTRDAAEQGRRAAAEELLNVVAQDLRIPLTPLRGHLDLIRQRAQREGRHDYLHNATQATAAFERLNQMISDLLDAGRLEHGLWATRPEPADLVALAQQTTDAAQSPETPITLRAPEELVLEADPEQVRQVLESLLGNAVQHSPPGVPVIVQLATEQRAGGVWAVLIVRDEGPGIAPDLLPTLFNRFARGQESQGLGLGLYLARGIAEMHGGTLTVESEVGKGTSFRLALPVAAAGDRT